MTYSLDNIKIFNATGVKITPHPQYEKRIMVLGRDEREFENKYRVLSNQKLESQEKIQRISIIGSPEETRKWLWDHYQQNRKLHWRHLADAKEGIRKSSEDIEIKKLKYEGWFNYFSILSLLDEATYRSQYSDCFIFINHEGARPIAQVIKNFGSYYLEEHLYQRDWDGKRPELPCGQEWARMR